jgi:1,4-dihydroxy-2-naphthoyl-CoA hydrolase
MSEQSVLSVAPEAIASGGFGKAMGLRLVEQGPERVVIEWTIGPDHLQPLGLVHGGVFAGVVESACSIGAMHRAGAGQQVVGVENHTSFLRPARSGELRCVATPIHAGQTTQLWQAEITDGQGKLVSSGRLRLFNVPKG